MARTMSGEVHSFGRSMADRMASGRFTMAGTVSGEVYGASGGPWRIVRRRGWRTAPPKVHAGSYGDGGGPRLMGEVHGAREVHGGSYSVREVHGGSYGI